MVKQDLKLKKYSPSVIKVLGNNCLAPMVLNKSIPEIVKAAKENGVAVLAITNSHHMAAMWPRNRNDSWTRFSCFCMHIL